MRAALSFRAKRHRPALLAVAGLMLAAAVFLMLPRARPRAPAPRPAPVATIVMIAARPISAGSAIAAADMRAKSVAGLAPAGAIGAPDAAIGRIAGRSYAAGDMLLADDLRDAASAGMAGRVTAGRRAFAIPVAEDEIVGGFLQSGDRVDVFAVIPGSALAAGSAQNLPDRSRAVLLLQDVAVLAVGENMATAGAVQSSARTVSLSLSPAELVRLALALRFGKVALAVRRPGDDAAAASVSAALADIVPPPPTRRRMAGVPFYSGTRLTRVAGE